MTKHLNKTYETMVSRQWTTASIEKGNKQGKPCDFLSLLPKENFQSTKHRAGTQTEPGSLSELRKQSSGLGRPMCLEFVGQNTGKESFTQREHSGALRRVPLKSLAEYWSVQAGMKTKVREKPLKWISQNNCRAHTGPGIVHVPTSQPFPNSQNGKPS